MRLVDFLGYNSKYIPRKLFKRINKKKNEVVRLERGLYQEPVSESIPV